MRAHSKYDRKKPPFPGGFSIHYVPWSSAVCQRFHDEMRRSHLVVESLTHGSWSVKIVNRKLPRGGDLFWWNRKPPGGGGFFRSICRYYAGMWLPIRSDGKGTGIVIPITQTQLWESEGNRESYSQLAIFFWGSLSESQKVFARIVDEFFGCSGLPKTSVF